MHPAGGRADVGHGAGGRWSLVLTYGVGGYADGGHHFSGFRPRRSTRGGEKQRGDGKQLSVNGEPDGDQEEWIDGLRRGTNRGGCLVPSSNRSMSWRREKAREFLSKMKGGSEDDAGTVRNDASSPASKHVLVK